MLKPIRILLLFLFHLLVQLGQAQPIDEVPNTLSYEAYLGYVKKHHPLVKQAELTLSAGEATVLQARGGFDPKIEVDYNRKKFKETTYYDERNMTFKIPTWYGVAFKANYEKYTGDFLNPNLSVPENGLYSAGVSFSVAQGLLINERMAALKKARFFNTQSKANRTLLVNTIVFDASSAYFDWVAATNEQHIFDDFLENARIRLNAVARSAAAGEKAEIDVVEARITLQNRTLEQEAAQLKRRKAALLVSTFLWLNNTPLEVQDEVSPIVPKISTVQASLLLEDITNASKWTENHPKILSLTAKINELTVTQRLKQNKLLPKLDLQYNFLSPERDQLQTFNTANYKAFLNFSLPLLLRQERGAIRLAKLKVQEANFERMATSLAIRNKISAIRTEIESLEAQYQLITSIVKDYETLVKAEERKFILGESSLFLINAREQKLIDAQLKANQLLVKQLDATATLYNTLGIAEPSE